MASEIKVDTIVNAGGDNDTGIDLSTNDVIKFDIAGAEKARVHSDGKVGIGETTPLANLHIKSADSGVTPSADSDELFIEGSGNSGITIGSGSSNSGTIRFADSGTDNRGNITFNHSNEAMTFTTAASERARIDSNGNVLIGKTATGTAAGVQLEPTGTANIARSGDLCLVLDRLTNAGEIVSIRQGTTAVGGIDANSSSTDFNTSSDYRLKENVTTSWDATTRLKQLKPVRFSWKIDSKSEADTDGFLAHEVSSVVPQAISGEKDAVDADGNPKHQGIDHSKLVALLVKTVQELEARIATLESK